MQVTLTSPCCLHLGYAHAEDGAKCELGITLQHPQIQLVAWPSAQLRVSGVRAQVAYAAAEKFLYKHQLPLQGDIEIEIAIPAHMGLGSDDMLQASMRRVLTTWHAVHTSFRTPLAEHALREGGLLLTNDEGLVQQRAAIAHTNDDDDWVFVQVWPKEPDDIADDYETQRLTDLRWASRHLSDSKQADAVFDAVACDDFGAFAKSLMEIHAANEVALAASGHPIELNDQDRDILDLMRANGAAMAARTLTGLGLYGLIKGKLASITLRQALTQHLGYFGPLVMASICDNAGARVKTD